jgi:hypothetical protein
MVCGDSVIRDFFGENARTAMADFMSELRASRYCSFLRSTLTLLALTRFLPL